MFRTLGLVAALAALAPAAAEGEIVVSAASSLTDVLQEVASRWREHSRERVTFNFGPSNALARQIASGARVDVFISADDAQMDVVASQLAPATRIPLLANQLAVAVPDDRPRRFRSMQDLAAADIRRIAIGDPAAVPAGVYARTYLEKIGLWQALAARMVPSGSVRLALAAVEAGAVDAAIVYRTDLAAARRAVAALVVPIADGPRIVYPAAILRNAPNPDGAKRFLAFLAAPDAGRVFERAGFSRP